jgi:long-chain acyl-CoA synthetase
MSSDYVSSSAAPPNGGDVSRADVERTITEALLEAPILEGPMLEYCGETWSQAELQDLVARVASGLKELGVEKGDRVTVYSHNIPEHIVILFAAARIGAVTAYANGQLRADEVAYLLNDAKPRVLIVSPETYDQALLASSSSPVDHLVMVNRTVEKPLEVDASVPRNALAFDSLRHSEPFLSDGAKPEDLAAIWYTSGTTGQPKGATWTHRNFLYNALAFVRRAGVGAGDVSMRGTNCAHNGLGTGAIGPLVAGGRLHLLPGVSPTRMVDLILRENVNYMTSAPAILRLIIERTREIGVSEFPSFKGVAVGASDFPSDLVAQVSRLLPNAVIGNVYGSSEGYFSANAIFAGDVNKDDQVASYGLGSVGRCFPDTEIRIVDGDGARLESNEVGVIEIRGPGVMSGYWQRPDATAKVLVDGWVRIGDLGRIDDQGRLWIVGRDRDVINTGGYNVYASEVEAVLMLWPGVSAAAVVGRPDAILGEHVVAYVQPDVGADVNATELAEYCSEHLAKYKCPREIHLRELPVNDMGKIQKHLIV